MTHYRLLTAERLAAPPIRCHGCRTTSFAAARHPQHICLLCEAKQRKKAGK